jgi:hypothetical protein
MPRYFFHVRDGLSYPDDEGTVLPDAEAARSEAIEAAGGMLRDAGKNLWNGEPWTMSVVDESGLSVCELAFTATIRLSALKQTQKARR